MLRALFFSFFSCWCLLLSAQQHHVFSPDLCTLRTTLNGVQSALPVITLGGQEQFVVSFDQMSHEHRRYVYRLEHCDYRWKPTEGLFANEMVEANQELTLIAQGLQSRNTMQQYTHHSFALPNREVRPLLSGNYRVHIYDEENTEQAVATVCFAVVEPLTNVQMQVSANTDIDWNEAHQQLSMRVNASRLRTQDLRKELHTVVLQNGCWDNAVWDAAPTQVESQGLTWQHQRALIFPAGNEYRRFEMLSTQQAGLHIDRLQWIKPLYHASLQVDEVQRNYLHIQDQNGISVIRTTDNPRSDTEADYVMTHFALRMPRVPNATVYIDGQWPDAPLSEAYRMTYDENTGQYIASLYLKQGYYSYRYLTLPDESTVATTAPTEGNFYQATNDYTVLVYHRSPALRYDRLVGWSLARSSS